jgi:DNA-binding PadR family transcriptional regulator
MPKEVDILTMVEWLFMAAILRNNNNGYGSSIFDTATELARPAKVSYGSLYPTLERLERRGFLSSSFSDPIPERGGRSRRYFSVTAAGQRAIKRSESLAKSIAQVEAWGVA